MFNDTGQECHGFEIELDGVSDADVTYTFGGPYQRYGNPTLVDFAGGVYVRYQSQYDTVDQEVPAGHAAGAGRDHPDRRSRLLRRAGSATTSPRLRTLRRWPQRNPTKTVYRWLVGDPATRRAAADGHQGQHSGADLERRAAGGARQSARGAGGHPGRPPEEPGECSAKRMWVKVFVTETPNQPCSIISSPTTRRCHRRQAEIEIEWVLLADGPGGPECREKRAGTGEEQIGEGNESITRRYEFYKYTGNFSVEGEALCEDPINGLPEDCGEVDANGLRGVGEYIGAQMAALNLNPPAAPTVSVSTTGNGSGTVTSTPAGIDCGATCSALFAAGDLITLTAAPDAGSFFVEWGGDCAGTDVQTSLTPNGDASCTATFELSAQSADLSLSAKQSPATAHAGKRVRYTMKVKALGPATASGSVLTADIGGAADLASIKAPKSCTVLGGSITCPLGDLKNKRAVTRLISVVPIAPGTVNVTANVTSSTLDPVSANNTAAIDTVAQ